MAYLDAGSASPIHPAAKAALEAALDDGWADPTRLHREGRRARALLDAARESLAVSLSVPRDSIIVCGGLDHSVRLVLNGVAEGRRRQARRLISSAVEQSTVLHALDEIARDGNAQAPERLGVDHEGRLSLGALETALAGDEPVALIALQSANQEVGSRQPLAAAADQCAQAGIPLVVDASCTAPWEPLPAEGDAYVVDPRRWGSPAGLGLAIVRPATRLRTPPLVAPLNEPPVPLVVAAAAGLEAVCAERRSTEPRMRALTELIRSRAAALPDTEVLGHPIDRVPSVVTFSCLYVAGEALATALDARGFSVSSGSACSSDTLEPSHVLAAMGALTHGNVRVSPTTTTTEAEVEHLMAAVAMVIEELRDSAGVRGL